MMSFPLMFSFRDLVAGNGFVARVVTHGRVLLVDEGDGDFWMYGVQPGGFSGGASGRDAALADFKNNYLLAVYDIATDAPSFEAFQEAVMAFLGQTNAVNAKDWDVALAEARRTGNISLDGLDREKAEEKPPSVRVELVQGSAVTPAANALPVYATAA